MQETVQRSEIDDLKLRYGVDSELTGAIVVPPVSLDSLKSLCYPSPNSHDVQVWRYGTAAFKKLSHHYRGRGIGK